MNNDDKWLWPMYNKAGGDLLAAMEKRLAEEFQYLGKKQTDSEADQAAPQHEATRSY